MQGVSSFFFFSHSENGIKDERRCKGNCLESGMHIMCTLNITELQKEQEDSIPPSHRRHRHLWWERRRHREQEGHWMWIIEQCPTDACLSIHITRGPWKKDNKVTRTSTNTRVPAHTASVQSAVHIYSTYTSHDLTNLFHLTLESTVYHFNGRHAVLYHWMRSSHLHFYGEFGGFYSNLVHCTIKILYMVEVLLADSSIFLDSMHFRLT